MQHTNQLINETSPYLLQHAHNPVDWCAWNEASWQRARTENKLVIISIGYSACHWCHVMEHESFEDDAVADLMNGHFICIKVDREERPDVDQIYMDAVQLISGRGGWPLNAFALPNGKPIYAGTYYPRENWKQVLRYFIDYWQNQRDEAYKRADDITAGIKQMDGIPVVTTGEVPLRIDPAAVLAKFAQVWDFELGGRTGAPKFPMPVNLLYLLRNYHYTKNQQALKAAQVTLDGMMNGGIYDQMGGGFARYSVDEYWAIPHFEKMLYDNAQLVSVYAEAYQLTRNPRYKEVVYETLGFVERELSDPAGGFYSALDADSEGEEGKFYVWSYAALQQLLGAEFDAFCKVYEVTPQGNFEGHINLTRISNEVTAEQLTGWRNLLMAERSKRVRPGLDDKVLTAWNSLMLKGYTDAYKAFADERFLNRALECAAFLKQYIIQPDYSIMRNYKNGRVTINGFLDDYSFTCEALLGLYEVTFNQYWLQLAAGIADYVVQHFYNVSTGMFFYTSVTDEPLIARKTETSDNVIPASNSSMAKVLFVIGTLLDNNDYKQKARRALQNMQDNAIQHPSFYANWAILSHWFINPPYEVAITGDNAEALRKQLSQHFLPHAIVLGAATASQLPLLQGKYQPGQSLLYVCYNKTCQLPVKSVAEALPQLART